LHLADHEEPQSRQKNQGSQIGDPSWPTLFARFLEPDLYSVLLKSIEHRRLACRRNDAKNATFAIVPTNETAGNDDSADLAVCDPC
jgi:hypothetical protein